MVKSKSQRTILVVEDNPLSMKLAVDLLELSGYDVLKAEDGQRALEISKAKRPDLILLDIMMPKLDGYEVCKRLKSSTETRFIPIIMITALKEREEKIKGIEVGADDFISKPFDKSELLARVRSLLRIKSLHDELEDSYKNLKELEKTKDNLTHMIVHDLNNSIMVISGQMQLLKMEAEEKFTEEQKNYLKEAFLASQDLERMTGNLLDINKMEEGRIKLNYASFKLGDIAKEVVDQMKPIVFDQDKILSSEILENMPIVSVDNELIRRVIANLVNNAIKFTPPKGSIFVKVFYKNNDNNFYIQVKDTGTGIPKEYLDKIFDKFIQVGTEQVKTGRGLGLTFCKMAIEAHQGRIWAESEPSKGSIFTFTLPYKR